MRRRILIEREARGKLGDSKIAPENVLKEYPSTVGTCVEQCNLILRKQKLILSQPLQKKKKNQGVAIKQCNYTSSASPQKLHCPFLPLVLHPQLIQRCYQGY